MVQRYEVYPVRYISKHEDEAIAFVSSSFRDRIKALLGYYLKARGDSLVRIKSIGRSAGNSDIEGILNDSGDQIDMDCAPEGYMLSSSFSHKKG